MSFRYQQSTGQLFRIEDGGAVLEGVCYSGHGQGLNQPGAQTIRSVGPIPQGDYTIGAPRDPPDHLGPLAMPLSPLKTTNTFGRSGFFLHGDNGALNHTASDGCIVAGRAIRQAVDRARREGDVHLQVTP